MSARPQKGPALMGVSVTIGPVLRRDEDGTMGQSMTLLTKNVVSPMSDEMPTRSVTRTCTW